MSSSKNSKNWTFGTLKSRGWTESLVKELLPAPVYHHFSGRKVRTWKKEDVQQAELLPRFQESVQAVQAAREAEIARERDTVEAALLAAVELLERQWQSAEKPEGAVSRLAEHYHRALTGQVYDVEKCENCDYVYARLVSSKYIVCCPPETSIVSLDD